MRRATIFRIFLALVVIYLLVYVASQTIFSGRSSPAKASTPPPPHDSGPLPVIPGPSRESRIEPRFSRVAALLAGRRAEVRCWSSEDWAKRAAEWARRWPDEAPLDPWRGYTSLDGERVNLPPAVCDALGRLAYETGPVQKDRWPEALAWSVAMLAHEAQHVRGIWGEAIAECSGMQAIDTAARALGRTGKEGRYLTSLYWKSSYPKHEDPAYRSPECRNGGRLDLDPQSSVWP
jgi:hypothetical protein